MDENTRKGLFASVRFQAIHTKHNSAKVKFFPDRQLFLYYHFPGRVEQKEGYLSAQQPDLLAAGSMLDLRAPDRWLYINAFHGRLQKRQEKVLALPPLETKTWREPDFLIIGNINERETVSRQAAANFLYQKSEGFLAIGTHAGAREAYAT